MRILIIEDAPRLAEALAEILRKNGYAADIARDGVSGTDAAATGAYDAILLDIMLPGRDGLSILRDMRAAGDATPVILLTARGDVGDRVRGLDAGADDYLPKPFHASELLARLRAVLRRPSEIVADDVLRAAGLLLDANARSIGGDADVAGASRERRDPLPLTSKEFLLAELLMRRAGRVVGKSEIIDAIWGAGACSAENRAEVLVHALRVKIAKLDAAAEIATIRGAGYMLRRIGESHERS